MQVYPSQDWSSNMGKLITVVGNSGAGKTTLVTALCNVAPLHPALEQHTERPFQRLFADNLTRYGLANQVDYLLLRAEQERAARREGGIAIHDGGLDLDFYGFAQLFHHQGYLTDAEFRLCERLYMMLRSLLPPPELVVYLTLPPAVAAERYRLRNRGLEITRLDDLDLLGELIDRWVESVPSHRLLRVDAGAADYGSKESITSIADAILDRLST